MRLKIFNMRSCINGKGFNIWMQVDRNVTEEGFTLRGYYPAYTGNWLLIFLGHSIVLIFERQTVLSLKMEEIICPETSVTNYQPTTRNILEERRPQLQCGGILKFRNTEEISVRRDVDWKGEDR
jgi:hypothetical protein